MKFFLTIFFVGILSKVILSLVAQWKRQRRQALQFVLNKIKSLSASLGYVPSYKEGQQ